MLLLFGCTDVIILIVTILAMLLWLRSMRPVNYPPGPVPIPIIGNIHSIASRDVLERFRDLRKKYGDVFSLSVGSFWVIVVNGTDTLRNLLVKRAEFTSDRPPIYLFNLFKNKGIMAASGTAWKQQRIFTLSKLRDFGFGKRSFEISILEELETFLKFLEKNGVNLDWSEKLLTSISNNILCIIIGKRFDYDDPKLTFIIKCMMDNAENFALSSAFNFAPFLATLPGDPLGARIFATNIEKTIKFFHDEIEEHKINYDDNNIKDFIDVYLKEIKNKENNTYNQYTEKQLEIILLELFSAGMETTATTLKWAILYLINHVDVQSKMREEIKEKVGFDRLPKMSDKINLPYCEAVINESLRLGNITPFALPHGVSENLDFQGYCIPKNSILIPNLDSVMHDETLFPDSKVFNPERFIGSDGRCSGHEKVLAFSLGRRVCLGESLARMELFLYLTSLIQRFKFCPADGESIPSLEGKLGITYNPVSFKCKAIRIPNMEISV